MSAALLMKRRLFVITILCVAHVDAADVVSVDVNDLNIAQASSPGPDPPQDADEIVADMNRRLDNINRSNDTAVIQQEVAALRLEVLSTIARLDAERSRRGSMEKEIGEMRQKKGKKGDEVDKIDYTTGRIQLKNGSWVDAGIHHVHGVAVNQPDESAAHDPALLHEDPIFLLDLVFIIMSATVCGWISMSFGFPSFVGFIFGGMLVGPSVLDIVKHVAYIESLAQAGVTLMLFESGIGFNREAARQAYDLTMWMFLAQVLMLGTIVPGLYAIVGINVSVSEMILLTLCLALSSSMVISEHAEEIDVLDSSSMRIAISVLAGQDLFMGLLLCLPEAFYYGALGVFIVLKQLIYGVLLAFIAVFLSSRFMPRFVQLFANRTDSKLFLLALLCLCGAASALSAMLGLSLEFGAMFAGVVLCRTELRKASLGRMRPLTEVFSGILFASIGMLLSPRFLLTNAITIVLGFIVIFAIKFSSAFAVARVFGFSTQTALTIGVCVSSLAEFSMIVAGKGYELGVVSRSHYLHILSIAVTSFAISPYLFQLIAPKSRRDRRHLSDGSIGIKSTEETQILHDV